MHYKNEIFAASEPLSSLNCKLGKQRLKSFLKDSKQLQSNRYGQEDDSKQSNVAIGAIHPLGWIWDEINKALQNVKRS